MPEVAGETDGQILGGVLGQPPRCGARGEDALDGLVLEGAVGPRVLERGAQIFGAPTLPQQQDASGVVGRQARAVCAQRVEKCPSLLSHAVVGPPELVEIGRAAPIPGVRSRMAGVHADIDARTARRQLVARDAREIRRVDEQLALRDADRQEIRDVLVGHRIAVAIPGDEAIDAADAIHDPRRVVWVARQGREQRLLLGEQLHARPLRASLAGPRIGDIFLPIAELHAHVFEIPEGAAVEEAPLELPEASLHPRLGHHCRMHAMEMLSIDVSG